MRERDLDRLFVAECKRRGIITYKTSSYGCRGFADRTLFGPGRRHGYVELKGSDGGVTSAQRQFAALAARSGAFYRLIKAPVDRADARTAIILVLEGYMYHEYFHPEYRPL